jgi:chitin synthase
LNPLVASQNFEYKMSNILDKPLESVFGYISVLPGAFSAYRYEALRGRPLECYFAGENPAADIFTSNLYLAEDRILCFELVTKKDKAWILKYVKSARAETDVPEYLPELTSQRRRWLNGSFFASVHALYNYRQIYQSPHTSVQKMLFSIEFLYNLFNLYFTWFALANFYLSFFFLFQSASSGATDSNGCEIKVNESFIWVEIASVLDALYIAAIVAMFVTALGNRPQGTKWLYYTISVLFSFLMIAMLAMGGLTIQKQFADFSLNSKNFKSPFAYVVSTPAFRDLFLSILSTYGLYLLASLMHMDPWHIFSSMIQYLLVLPTYNNIFMIYAFCNLHDVSWGTKGATTMDEQQVAVKKKGTDGTTEFEFEYSTEQEDVDAEWSERKIMLSTYVNNPVVESSVTDDKTAKEDSTKIFRTNIVLSWIFSNMLLIGLFTNKVTLKLVFPHHQGSINPYLTFLFWSVAAISLVRAIGSTIYMAQWIKERKEDLFYKPIRTIVQSV